MIDQAESCFFFFGVALCDGVNLPYYFLGKVGAKTVVSFLFFSFFFFFFFPENKKKKKKKKRGFTS
jgi:hypothetical protein